jgi:hypothetical protein
MNYPPDFAEVFQFLADTIRRGPERCFMAIGFPGPYRKAIPQLVGTGDIVLTGDDGGIPLGKLTDRGLGTLGNLIQDGYVVLR